jgi:hypothetical protein
LSSDYFDTFNIFTRNLAMGARKMRLKMARDLIKCGVTDASRISLKTGLNIREIRDEYDKIKGRLSFEF